MCTVEEGSPAALVVTVFTPGRGSFRVPMVPFSVCIYSTKKAWLIHSIPALAHKVTAVTFYKALPNLFNCWSNWRYNWREVM